MLETSKALRRLMSEGKLDVFSWSSLFKGNIIDVGCLGDKLPFPNCIGFDIEGADVNGDANKLSDYFTLGDWSLIWASHVLEHLRNPEVSLRDWLTLLKPGGYIYLLVPDVGAYERFKYPSSKNADHKASFSMIYRGSTFPIHYHIPTLCDSMANVAETIIARYVERNFDWKQPDSIDQTFISENGTEIWNEVLLRKL